MAPCFTSRLASTCCCDACKTALSAWAHVAMNLRIYKQPLCSFLLLLLPETQSSKVFLCEENVISLRPVSRGCRFLRPSHSLVDLLCLHFVALSHLFFPTVFAIPSSPGCCCFPRHGPCSLKWNLISRPFFTYPAQSECFSPPNIHQDNSC